MYGGAKKSTKWKNKRLIESINSRIACHLKRAPFIISYISTIICFIIYIKYFFRSEVSLENEISYNLMLFYLHNKSLFVLMTVICNEKFLVFFFVTAEC